MQPRDGERVSSGCSAMDAALSMLQQRVALEQAELSEQLAARDDKQELIRQALDMIALLQSSDGAETAGRRQRRIDCDVPLLPLLPPPSSPAAALPPAAGRDVTDAEHEEAGEVEAEQALQVLSVEAEYDAAPGSSDGGESQGRWDISLVVSSSLPASLHGLSASALSADRAAEVNAQLAFTSLALHHRCARSAGCCLSVVRSCPAARACWTRCSRSLSAACAAASPSRPPSQQAYSRSRSPSSSSTSSLHTQTRCVRPPHLRPLRLRSFPAARRRSASYCCLAGRSAAAACSSSYSPCLPQSTRPFSAA